MRWHGRSLAGTKPFRATEAFSPTARPTMRPCTLRWRPSTWNAVKPTKLGKRPPRQVVSTRHGGTLTSCRLWRTISVIVPLVLPRHSKEPRHLPRTTRRFPTSWRDGWQQRATMREPRRRCGSETARDEGIRDGARALHQADLPGALDHFKAAVTRHPDSSEARRMLGLAYKSDEQYAQSIEQLKAAAAALPRGGRSYYQLALLY